MADNRSPPPAPLMISLGDTPQKMKDIHDLRMFLLLLWERLGGADDPVEEAIHGITSNEVAISRLRAALSDEIKKRISLEQDLEPRDPEIHRLRKEVEMLKRDLPTKDPEVSRLRREVEALKQDHTPPINLSGLIRRIEAIEAQI